MLVDSQFKKVIPIQLNQQKHNFKAIKEIIV